MDEGNGIALFSNKISEPMYMTTQMVGKLAHDIITSLKVKTKQDVMKAPTANAEAYEYYLKAKYIHEKRENMQDTEIARGFYQKSIELDDNLIAAKVGLGYTYFLTSDYDRAMEIYSSSLQQANKLGDKSGIGYSLNGIGNVYGNKGDLDTALHYYELSLKIRKEIGDKRGMRGCLGNIGIVYLHKGDLDTALDYVKRSLAIDEEIGDKSEIGIGLSYIGGVYLRKGDLDTALDYVKRSLTIFEDIGDKLGMGYSLLGIGIIYMDKGDLDTALDYYGRSLAIFEDIGDKYLMGMSLINIGGVYFYKVEYEKAEKYLEKSLSIYKEIGIGGGDLLWSTTYLYLTYRHFGKDYDVKEIHSLIKDAEHIEFELNYAIYQLLEDKSYLETAYTQIQDKADAMEDEYKSKFLSYPIPKAIVEEWEKVTMVKN